MSAQQCERLLIPALESEQAAQRVARSLNQSDLDVLRVYRRYWNMLDGGVLRAELLSRGLLEVADQSDQYMRWTRWKYNPLPSLTERLLLLSPDGQAAPLSSFSYGEETRRSLPTYVLHPGVAQHIMPAEPSPWKLQPLHKTPQALGVRSFAVVALDLSSVFRFLTTRGSLNLTKGGDLGSTLLRALVKSVPLANEDALPLPDLHALYVEVLRSIGLLAEHDQEVRVDPKRATDFIAASDVRQAMSLARAWCETSRWRDGTGRQRWERSSGIDHSLVRSRRVLAWALGGAASTPDAWWGLGEFVTFLYEVHGLTIEYGSFWGDRFAWTPSGSLDRGLTTRKQKKDWQRDLWFRTDAVGISNAIMVTLPALGLIERGRTGRSPEADCFRLTPLGRAVFGAPEVHPPADIEEEPFLVVQPNFDVIAYLDKARASSASFLGRIAVTTTRTEAVQSFQLTRDSIYHALESGLTHDQVLDFLSRHNKGPIPPNLIHTLTDWSSRRESIVIRTGVSLIAFRDQAARDTWLTGKKATPCGERFALVPPGGPVVKGGIRVDHEGTGRQTMLLDDDGIIRSIQPLDLVQRARLNRIADPQGDAWRLCVDSVRRAARSGLKGERIEYWLEDDLRNEIPPLLRFALLAWSGKATEVQLGEAILIHIPNDELYDALLSSPRIRALLNGQIGEGWLAVRPEAKKELVRLLTELGFKIDSILTPDPLAYRQNGE
jgi:hypothetical protein